MKRFLKGLLFAFVAVFGVTLASCTETKTPTQNQPTEHTHSLAEGWKRDSATHWQECSECDELVNLDVHDYPDWTLATDKCEKTRDCKVCGFRETRAVDHKWNEAGECTVCGETLVITQYYVRGSFAGSDWPAKEEFKLPIDYSSRTATITVSLTAGDEFKVADAKWSAEFNAKTITCKEGLFGGDNNIIVKTTADYKIVLSKLETTSPVCTITQLCVHEYDGWTLVEGKTCEKQATCSNCGATATKVEHAGYSEFKLVEGKTCDWESVCACGDKKTEVRHTWGDDIICDDCEAVNIVDYFVRGNAVGTWDAVAANKLTVNKEAYTASITLDLKAGEGFKVADANWAFQFGFDADENVVFKDGGSGNMTVLKDGAYTITISGLDTLEHTYSITTAQPFVYYLMGDEFGWEPKDENALVIDAKNNSASLVFAVTDVKKGFKVATNGWAYQFGFDEEGNVVANLGTSGNMTVAEAGNYKIVIKNVNSPSKAEFSIEKHEGEVENVRPVANMYVVGSHNGWGDAFVPANQLVANYQGTELSATVYLAKDTQFKVSDAKWATQFGFGAKGLTVAEGLFTNEGGNLKVTVSGLYSIKVKNIADATKAECEITLANAEMTLAEAKAAAAGTNVLVSGTVKSVNNNEVVLTDGAQTPTELTVYLYGHVCVGDVVALTGKLSAKDGVNVLAELKDDGSVKNNARIYNVISQANVSDAKQTIVTSSSQLVDGAQLLITYNQFVMGSQSGNYRVSIINHNEACAQVVTLVKSGDNWLLKVGEDQYLYYSGSGNSVSTGKVVDESAQWTIKINRGVTTIVNVKDTERFLQANVNAGQERFACYKGTQQNPTLKVVD